MKIEEEVGLWQKLDLKSYTKIVVGPKYSLEKIGKVINAKNSTKKILLESQDLMQNQKTLFLAQKLLRNGWKAEKSQIL